jgi:hypothetical protein
MCVTRRKTDLSLNEMEAILGKRHYRADLGFGRELGKIERGLS